MESTALEELAKEKEERPGERCVTSVRRGKWGRNARDHSELDKQLREVKKDLKEARLWELATR